MASAVLQESAPLTLAMPLTAPSVAVALEHLRWMVPATVFSAGSGRRRRRGVAAEPGRRSDTGFLVFYRAVDGHVTQQPLKSPRSIEAYLRQQLAADPAEHWCALQLTQYRGRRDGRRLAGGFSATTSRHILGVVVDMDGSRMAPKYQYLLHHDFYSLMATIDERMSALGVNCYRVVRSGPNGLHLYIPFIRPDGRPLRATEKTLAAWQTVATGLARYLSDLGADVNAVKPTQPFALPGLPRAKHPGHIPYVAGGRDGARVDIWALLRSLSARKALLARERVSVLPDTCGDSADLQTILEDIRDRAAGVPVGCRNQVAHDVAVYLLAKGASPEQAWGALVCWNARNETPLRERELRTCFKSAQRCRFAHPGKWAEMQRAPWRRLRSLLGLPVDRQGYLRRGRWRPLTPARSWEERKLSGGREHYHEVAERLLSHLLARDGGRWEITQRELADLLGAALSTLKVVLKHLAAEGRIQVQTTRGRNGKTVLTALEQATKKVDDNSQSGNSSEAVQSGAWVGRPVCAAPAVPAVAFGVSSGLGACGAGRVGVGALAERQLRVLARPP